MRFIAFASLVFVSIQPALAIDCKVVEIGTDNAVVETASGSIEYRLVPQDHRWEVDSDRHHANATVFCNGCEPGNLWGMLWIEAANGSLGQPSLEEDGAFVAFQSVLRIGLGDDAPLKADEHHTAQWGPLDVSARRFLHRIADKRGADLIAVSATDGCVRLRFYLGANPTAGLSLKDQLDPLLRQMAVTTAIPGSGR